MSGRDGEFKWKDGITLKEYVDVIFAENRRAIDKAEATMNARLEGMNEFRDTLKDQASRFVTREDMNSVNDKITKLQLSEAVLAGKASQKAVNIALAISLIGLGIQLAEVLLK